jgi:hypothetical protein
MKTVHDKQAERVTVLDQRYYKFENEYFPSVTTVLRQWSPEPYLIDWFKNNGRNADIILREAGKRGTMVHDACEALLKGEVIDYQSINLVSAWEMILGFTEWMIEYDVKPECVELQMASPLFKTGGTLDLICKIGSERWLVDYKTSNAMQDTYFIQLAIYKEMYEDLTGEEIDKVGVLWLNAKTRGADRTGKKMQGKGWQMLEPKESHADRMEDWTHLKAIHDRRNPTPSPADKKYPSKIKLLREHTLIGNNL